MPFVVFFFDFVQTSFAQRSVVNLFIFPVLPGQVTGLYHFEGNGVEQSAVFVPVKWVSCEDLFVALSVGGHCVTSIVPHIFVVHGFYILRTAQLINHALRHWVQTAIGSYRWEVWHFCGAMVNNGVIIRSFHFDHFAELGTILCGQSQSLFLAQGLGPLIVLVCTNNHFQRHCGVRGVVLVEVQNPLQTGCEVLCSGSCFFAAVYINPFNVITQIEGPCLATVFAIPCFCDTWNQLTSRVGL